MLRLLLVLPIVLSLAPWGLPAPDIPPVQSGQIVESELADWLRGTLSGIYVEGGELRLQPGQTSGTYESMAVQVPFGLNAAVLQWHATTTQTQTVTFELRSSVDGQAWTEWEAARRS